MSIKRLIKGAKTQITT